jgi:hypothetical protein
MAFGLLRLHSRDEFPFVPFPVFHFLVLFFLFNTLFMSMTMIYTKC